MSCHPCKVDMSHLGSQVQVPLERMSDMPDEMKTEAMDLVVGAIEKYPENYELASKQVKEQMDKKFGATWHCVMGEGFGFEITYELKHLMYMFHRGTTAIVIFKALV